MSITKVFQSEDLQDMSLYLQGLMQIMASDNQLHENQKTRIRTFAQQMGFESEFVEKTIQSILDNKYIPKSPAKFHSKKTAESFLREAAIMATCDGYLHPSENEWLCEAATKNGINVSYISEILASIGGSEIVVEKQSI